MGAHQAKAALVTHFFLLPSGLWSQHTVFADGLGKLHFPKPLQSPQCQGRDISTAQSRTGQIPDVFHWANTRVCLMFAKPAGTGTTYGGTVGFTNMDTPGTFNSQGRRDLDLNPQPGKVGSVREFLECFLPQSQKSQTCRTGVRSFHPFPCFSVKIRVSGDVSALQGAQGAQTQPAPSMNAEKPLRGSN